MSHSSKASTASVLFNIGSVEVTTKRLCQAIGLIALVAALSIYWQHLDIDDLHRRAQALPASAVVVCITLLPLIGFPVSWLHLIAGVRFGFAGGMIVVALTTVAHHALGWMLVRVLPRRWFARITPWREKLAGAGHRDATLLCALLPGMPYSVQLYLLPIIGVPLPLLIGLSSLLHTGRAIVTILLGDLSENLTPGRIAALVAYYVILVSVCWFALSHLRRVVTKSQNTKARSARN